MPFNNAYRAAIAEYIRREARPVDKYGHQPRLYSLSKQVGEGQTYDDDVVYAAAWLHDIGVFIGHRPEDPDALARWDNVVYALARVPELLAKTGFPVEKHAAVLEAIRTHQPSGEPVAIEGIILRDADILEQLGTIAVLRTVCKVGRDTRFPTHTDAVASLRRSLDHLPGQIRLATTHALAKPKIEVLKTFLEAVEQESENALF